MAVFQSRPFPAGILPGETPGEVEPIEGVLDRVIRRIISPKVRRAVYQIRQRVTDHATSGVILPLNPARDTAWISVSGSAIQFISLVPGIPAGSGIPIERATSPLVLTTAAYGEMAQAEWFFSGVSGVVVGNEVTIIERIRVT